MVDWERRVETERVVVRARPIRAFAAETVNDLRRSLVRIEGWTGSAFPRDSRFHQALAVLGRVASSGQFVVDDTAGESTMRAIQLALDTLTIADALPDQRVADLRNDLDAAGVGALLGAGATRALQAESQLIVRAAFYRAGVKPSQPTHSGAGGRKKPDILIENGTANHPIEVKRPTAPKNVVPRALDAAEQLRSSTSKGGMVIDVTDCLADATPETADDAVVAHADAIGSQFFVHGSGWKPGYSHVLMVGVMARPAWHLNLTAGRLEYAIESGRGDRRTSTCRIAENRRADGSRRPSTPARDRMMVLMRHYSAWSPRPTRQSIFDSVSVSTSGLSMS